MGKPRIKMPRNAKSGQIVELKCLMKHPMESGNRRSKDGKPIPRLIINKFTVSASGEDIYSVDMHPSVSKNPYFSFFYKVSGPEEMTFTWVEDGGKTTTAKRMLKVG